jgi:uncharacterized membrane protein YkvA (DUF1232 family)
MIMDFIVEGFEGKSFGKTVAFYAFASMAIATLSLLGGVVLGQDRTIAILTSMGVLVVAGGYAIICLHPRGYDSEPERWRPPTEHTRAEPMDVNPQRIPEIAGFVHKGAARITPRILRGVHKKLPLLKVEFAQINAPRFPHLVDQLVFLADVVEDFADGTAEDLPFVTIASAAFALIYAHRQMDLFPESIPEFGHADDSGVVRTVLIEHERFLSSYADRLGVNWAKITVQP